MTNLEQYKDKKFPVDRGHCVTVEQQLLYNMYLNLELLVDVLVDNKEQVTTQPEVKPVSKPSNPKKDNKCPRCGKVHKTAKERLNCAEKHKKKG